MTRFHERRSMSGEEVVTAHREQSPVRRFRAMTWRTISHRLYRPELSSTAGRHARSGSRCPCRDGTGSSPSDSPRRQMVCESRVHRTRALSLRREIESLSRAFVLALVLARAFRKPPRRRERWVGPRRESIGVPSVGRLSARGRYRHRIGRPGGFPPEGEVFRAGPLNLALASC